MKITEVCNIGYEFETGVEKIEILNFPDTKIIGKKLKCKNKYDDSIDEMWLSYEIDWKEKLVDITKLVKNASVGFYYDFDEVDDTHMYIIGVIAPADAICPEDFFSVDVKGGIFVKGIISEWINETNVRLEEYGYSCIIDKFADLFIEGEELCDISNRKVGRLLSRIKKIE